MALIEGPRGGLVQAGKSITLTCKATVTPTAYVTWMHNGRPIEKHTPPKVDELPVEARLGIAEYEAHLTLPCASEADSGEYSCVFTSPCSEPITGVTALIVQGTKASTCSPLLAAPTISLFTPMRMETPHVPVQLMCRTSSKGASISWEIIDGGKIEAGTRGFRTLPNGDLVVSVSELPEADTISTLALRCTVHSPLGVASADSALIITDL